MQANLECGPSSSSSTLKQEPKHIQQAILKEFPNVCLSRPKWIKHHSTVYKTSTDDVYVIYGSDGLDPVFAKLISIIVLGTDYPMFEVALCKTLYFDDHFHSYALTITASIEIISYTKLYDQYVYHGYQSNDITFITLRYYFQ